MLVVVLFWITIFTFEDERNFLRDPPSGVPFHFESDSMYPVALATLQEDKNLSKMRFQLVPKKWVCDMTKFCFLILQSRCLFYNQNVMVKLSSFEVLILDSNNCVYLHSWFKSKLVQNNFKVAQVWFVFVFAQELSRNDQLSRTKEKTNYKFKIILIRIHFHLHVPIQHEHLNSCTNTAGLFSGSPVLWNCEI